MELHVDQEIEMHTGKRTVGGVEGPEETYGVPKPWYFTDLVKQTWNALEQIHAHQEKMFRSPDVNIEVPGRDLLEGYGFVDIAERNFPVRPRVARLEPTGRGWVDFTRKIGARTLFGRGFGELIRPGAESGRLCSRWNHLPTGQDFPVAQVSTLQKICERNGDPEGDPLQLAQGIYWHKAHQLFEPCICNSRGRCDPVQVLLPRSLGEKRYPNPWQNTAGAAVFGRSERWPWLWPKKGKPTQTDSHTVTDEQPNQQSSPVLIRRSSGLLEAATASMTAATAVTATSEVSSNSRAPETTTTSAPDIISPIVSPRPPNPKAKEQTVMVVLPKGKRGFFRKHFTTLIDTITTTMKRP